MERFKIGELLGKSSRLLSNRLTQELKDVEIELTPEQWMILHAIVESPKSQQQLCSITLKNKASINSLVTNLLKSGMVNKTTSKHDRRNNVISISGRGNEIKSKSNAIASKTLNIALNGFSDQEVTELAGFLERIKANLIHS